MIRVGVAGLGMMGNTHLDIYAGRDDVKVEAIADRDPDKRSGKAKAGGNIEGQAQGGFSVADLDKKYEDAQQLIDDPDIDLVDICLPTPLHLPFAEKVLNAGKHLMVEKPLARSGEQARSLVQTAANAKGLTMVGMCMRFWPGWDWLKEAVDNQTYGKVLAAHFRRLASFPGGPFYSDGAQSGGAILDLHIHDTDFVQYCFGMPKGVFSQGYSNKTSEPDHVVTQYLYDNGPLVTAEGGWAMTDGFDFTMEFTINFENASAKFDLSGGSQPLTLIENGKEPVKIELRQGMGYEYEIGYFLECIAAGKAPKTVTIEDAAKAVYIVEAERKSIHSGQIVTL